jgi:hypothetical protein
MTVAEFNARVSSAFFLWPKEGKLVWRRPTRDEKRRFEQTGAH